MNNEVEHNRFSILIKTFFSEVQFHCMNRRGGGVSSLPIYVMTIIQIFYALVCICGLVGNSLVIYVVLRYGNCLWPS